jgi:hypothetical protein
MAKRAKKEGEKTVRFLEARTLVEAEALAQLGFELVGMDENGKVFQFKEPTK